MNFFNRAYAAKLKRKTAPRSLEMRKARTAARVGLKEARQASKQPLDSSRAIPEGLSWFAVSCASRREFEAARAMEGQGWFTIVVTRVHERLLKSKRGGKGQRRETIILPQFTGWIFAGFEGVPNWLALSDIKIVRGPVHCNGVPLPLPQSQVEVFHKQATRKAAILKLKEGGRARIISGPFEGHELDVSKIKGQKAKLIQSWFGAAREIEMAVDALEPVEHVAA